MSNDTIGGLLREVADAVEPADRLDAIRAATADGARRAGRGWWAAGGVALVAASVVTALALSTGGESRSGDPDPAAPQPTTVVDPTTSAVPVYVVGDTPRGQRLYREFRQLPGDPLAAAADALALPPDDPDYVSLWPRDAILDVSFDGVGDQGLISVTVDRALAMRMRSMTSAQAALAVEQAVRTFQAATQSSAPVQFSADGNPISMVLGIPTSEPLSPGSDLAMLAHVNLSDPFEGQVVDNDEPFIVRGIGNGFEGTIITRIQQWEGTSVVEELPAIAGTYEDRLFPFEVTFDLADIVPGDYVVISRTDDPSGRGSFETDTRRIMVVD